MSRKLIVLAVLALCACRGQPVIDTPVVAKVEAPPKIVPVPVKLLTGCTKPVALAANVSNGELLRYAKALETYSGCLDDRLKAIAELGK